MTVKDNRPAAHTENHTEAINKDIEAHIDHQDRTTSHDNNHNNNITHQQTTEQQHSKYQHTSIYEEPQCFRCGQYGHYKNPTKHIGLVQRDIIILSQCNLFLPP